MDKYTTMKNATPTQYATPQVTLHQPFTLEQLREDILNIYLLQLRTTCLIANDQKVWGLANKSGFPDGKMWDPTWHPRDFDLTYADIQDTNLAQALEQQYSFGFMGFDNLLCEPMGSETLHTWVAAYLTDLQSSAMVNEWESYGADIDVSRCIYTCELANARNVLEGDENFFSFTGRKDDEENNVEKALTVHQMALLSGMEEMTIRTAISRKSANQLQAFKDDRRTLISIDEAKTWLTAKGRYVPVTRQTYAGADLHLEGMGFLNIREFADAMLRRVSYLVSAYPESNVVEQLMQVASSMGSKDINFMHREMLLNQELMAKVADILQLPTLLLALRAKESVQRDDLAQTIKAVNEASEQLRSV